MSYPLVLPDVLDRRELAFMDSSGVHTIVDASVHARQVDALLALPEEESSP